MDLEAEVCLLEDTIEGHPEEIIITTILIRREEEPKVHGGTTDLPSSATNVAETTT